ncbi:MAG TPA: ATPase domain-containing protein [Lacunisphaera sp.]|nr:ATPase domain-containing protein [Lacunisphaera sp.]
MSPSPHPPTQLCKTGIDGFDDILNGGLPRNRVYLVLGEPGVGKTTLALQFLLEGQKMGERGLYITLSETTVELNEVAASHGWDLSTIDLFELSALEAQIKDDSDTTFFSPSEVELNRTTQVLLDEVDRIKPMRVVFDSLSELRLMSETALRYRRQILYLKQYFAGQKCTVLLLDDNSARGEVDDQVESLAHGVMVMTKTSPDYGISRRQVRVQKIRGVKFREGNHDLLMETGGLVVFPRLVAAEHHKRFVRESVSSNVVQLDQLLGGGLDRGTSTIFMGPAGTGKSTLSMCFALAAAQRGERVMLYTFDETIGTLQARSAQLALDLEGPLSDGRLQIAQIDPAEISPGELAYRIKQGVQEEGVRMVVIDSLNGYLHAMPDQRHLTLQLHELLAFLNQQGVSTLLVLTQQGLVGSMQSPVDLTYLADTVVLMRYFEYNGAVRQAISVIKKRSGNHERTIREFSLGATGITVGEPLIGFQGVLSGIPLMTDRKPGAKS